MTPISGLIKKFWNTFGKDSMKIHFQIKKLFTVKYVEDITDEDYIHTQKLFEGFEINILGE